MSVYTVSQARTQNFSLGNGGTDPEAIYKFSLILKLYYKSHVIHVNVTQHCLLLHLYKLHINITTCSMTHSSHSNHKQ
jgi:hypothetical protein